MRRIKTSTTTIGCVEGHGYRIPPNLSSYFCWRCKMSPFEIKIFVVLSEPLTNFYAVWRDFLKFLLLFKSVLVWVFSTQRKSNLKKKNKNKVKQNTLLAKGDCWLFLHHIYLLLISTDQCWPVTVALAPSGFGVFQHITNYPGLNSLFFRIFHRTTGIQTCIHEKAVQPALCSL